MSLIDKVCKLLTVESTIHQPDVILTKNDVITVQGTYNDYVNDMKRNGYHVDHLTLKDTSGYLLSVHNLSKNKFGSFLEIKCPVGKIMTICGSTQCNDLRFFISNPNLCDIPHYFSIKCINENGEELSDDCVIDIIRVTPSEQIENIDSIFYTDISLYKFGKFKEKQCRYYFSKGIILSGDDILMFKTTPNIDITKVDLLAKIDMFTKRL